MKYKLKVRNRFGTSRSPKSITAEFVWENKDDALSCMRLMEKAKVSKFTDVSFVEFEEEKPLRQEGAQG